MSASVLERLSAHRMLATLPPEQIVWVAKHGALHQLDSGAVLTSQSGPVAGLHVVLSGHLSIHVDAGAGRRKVMEWRDGDVTGLLPYSRLASPPGDVVAEEPSDVFTVDRERFPEMIHECYELTAMLVHVMLDRARHFNSSFLHDEKLVSLGKLSAGLAHELNNPASAIARSASALEASFDAIDSASRGLGAAGLNSEQAALLERVKRVCLAAGSSPVLTPLEQEDREDSIAQWLKTNGADRTHAEALAESNVTLDALDQLAASMKGPVLHAALRWIAMGCTTRRLTGEIHEASSRIYGLVAAIKGFTQMDRAAVTEPVDIAQGLANTVVILRSKAKDKSVGLTTAVDEGLPCVDGFGGELNQVWANLIDNALDAVHDGGRVELKANREGDTVVVRVIDDGPGVPEEIRGRIFDPFFTTKPIGKGTGLGLDIVRRLVQRHNGQIDLDSKPGRSEFRVTLPVTHTARTARGSAS